MGTDPRYQTSIEEQWQDFIDSQDDVKVGTTPTDSGKGKDKPKTKSTQQFDWISRALERLSSRLDLVKTKYDNLFASPKVSFTGIGKYPKQVKKY